LGEAKKLSVQPACPSRPRRRMSQGPFR